MSDSALSILLDLSDELRKQMADIDDEIYRLIDDRYELEENTKSIEFSLCLLAKTPGMYSRGGKLEQAKLLLVSGHSMRQIRDKTGLASSTISKLRRVLREQGIEPKCACGRKSSHKGWCSARYASSPKRQAFMKTWHSKD